MQTVEAVRMAGSDALALVGDLREAGWLERLDRAAPAVDIVVHNAAAFATYAPLEQVPEQQIVMLLDVIVRVPLSISAHVVAGMKQRGFGRIVSIGTIAATHGAHGQVAYAAAKSALYGFTRSLAAESARYGVTCNLVEPGLITTERIAESVAPQFQRGILRNTALERPGRPEDIAAAVAFLCSPRAANITGAVLPSTGGFGLGLYARDLD